ncbi:MAG TPA: hypothetical protein VN661_08170 [Candidatus Acidoferrales bacterium]|nr:hypothetical protein [Candidatus Acidoferrales bacterium]
MWDEEHFRESLARAGRIGWKLAQVLLFMLAFVYGFTVCLAGKFWHTPELSFTCPLLLPMLAVGIVYSVVRLIREIRK